MKVSINHITIHELIKEPIQSEIKARIEFSDTVLEVNEQAETLIEALNNRYSSGRELITYAVFDTENAQPFPLAYKAYSEKSNDEKFLHMTCSTLTNLKDQIQNINFAKGGYFIYADYNTENSSYFGVFLIRNTKGILFTKDASSKCYQINPAIHIDLEKIAMGCRINKAMFNGNNGKYLSFTKKNQKEDISDYFIKWVSAKELNNNKICTEQLSNLINKISPLPKDDQDKEISREEFKRRIYEMVISHPKENLNLATLSEHFYGESNYIAQYAQENNFIIDTEFKPDRRILRKFIQVSIKEGNIKLEFSYDDFNDKIRLDEVNRNLILIESKQIADKIREFIEGEQTP